MARQDAHYQRVPLYNFFGLSRYYELTGEALPSTVLQKAKAALDNDMAEQDWATSYWFSGFANFYSYPIPVSVANRHFAGLVGLVKLAKMAGDSQTEGLGRALLAESGRLASGNGPVPSLSVFCQPHPITHRPRLAAKGRSGRVAG